MIKERNYGIDLFRLTAMLGIVIFHILGHGGVVNSLKLSMGGELYCNMGNHNCGVWIRRWICIA